MIHGISLVTRELDHNFEGAGSMMDNGDSLLEVRGVSKTFDGVVRALKDVSLRAEEHQITGVVGENGAGKSTLMKILVGVHEPDEGELYIKGERVPFPDNPKQAAEMGISIVYQENGVIPWLQVYQFLLLGHEGPFTQYSKLDHDAMKRKAREALRDLNVECDVTQYMHELPLSTQKLVEIARAVLSVQLESGDVARTPIILLDEPTTPLTDEQRAELFDNLRDMKQTVSFFFISHIIPEVQDLTDRLHVLRDGRLISSFDLSREDLTEEDLFEAIVGRESAEFMAPVKEETSTVDHVVLSARNLTKQGHYYDISFELQKGECLGFFGAAGSGKNKIIRTLAGILSFDEGELMKGRKLHPDDGPHGRLDRGIGYFSGETGKELFLNWSIAQNLTIINLKKVVGKYLPFLNFRSEKRIAENLVRKLEIVAPSVYSDCYSLSGGNKQKVSVGKWLERNPDVLLLHDPTIGIDVGAREDIYEILSEMKKAGISMVLVSDDPKEYSIVCDKIVSLRHGRIQEVLQPEEFRHQVVEA